MEHVQHRTVAGSLCGLRVFTNLGKYGYISCPPPANPIPHHRSKSWLSALTALSTFLWRVLHWAFFRIPLFPKSLGCVNGCHYHRDCDPSIR